ncbi:EF-hand domain-containing protein [Magnetospirillum molischianum]|uniref:EF-hand domain-containing protein n=1 Tax=Magnetospirillum molischianum DSM 120 TaxID=1150626 RepID=H8FPW1_MAGML|nr:hypothetical protein [Magnetospirillum molischianum]CCG40399.1 conserved exported hypothetical protein [Magnetospirillum molischianum DSM 120]
MTGKAWNVVFLAVGLAACSGSGDPGGASRSGSQHAPSLSPNAEPLTGGALGWRGCEAALDDWAVRVDSVHRGTVSRQDFLADARAQFARMDSDGDGFITADELSVYRAPFRPEAPPKPPHIRRDERDEDDGSVSGRVGFPGGGWGGRSGGRDGDGGRERPNPANGIDPVMSADTNLDFKVSLDEFLHQANLIFDSLDLNHNGVLDQAELRRFCLSPSK